jgi:hypothetical protein
MAEKTCCRSAAGTRGLVIPLAVSHKGQDTHFIYHTGCIDSTGDLNAVIVSGHLSLLPAMVRKSMRPSKAAMATASEGGEVFNLSSRRAAA